MQFRLNFHRRHPRDETKSSPKENTKSKIRAMTLIFSFHFAIISKEGRKFILKTIPVRSLCLFLSFFFFYFFLFIISYCFAFSFLFLVLFLSSFFSLCRQPDETFWIVWMRDVAYWFSSSFYGLLGLYRVVCAFVFVFCCGLLVQLVCLLVQLVRWVVYWIFGLHWFVALWFVCCWLWHTTR